VYVKVVQAGSSAIRRAVLPREAARCITIFQM
jgi:hypothetical protein